MQVLQEINSGKYAIIADTYSLYYLRGNKMDLPERDGDGYLTDMNAWTADIARAMAEADNYEKE